MAGRADITLTLATRLEGVDAEAKRLHDELVDASRASGRDSSAAFGGEFAKGLIAQEPKIARAYEKTVTTISRVTEVREKHNRSVEQSILTAQREADALDKVNRLKESGTASTRELADAEDALAVAVDENTSAMNRRITLSNQLVRLNRDHASAVRLVVKAQDEVAADGGVGQSLLTAGKFISALRAVAIPAIGLTVGALGANIVAVTAAAAQGLWMIPAAAGAAGAAIGTLSVATMGFSDTVKEMGDPEKFAEAIQNLSPNAQQAALAIQALMEPLTALKNNVQDALFADFGPMINGLANQYMPAIEGMMTGIAGAFNTAAKSVFEQLMNPATQQVITNTINSLVTAFQNLAPAAGPFFDAMSKIIETGASYLPQIADAATNAAREFSTFITNAQASGDLSRWFQEGLNTIDQLWEMVKILGGAFMDLAPIGREHIPQITEMLKSLAAVIPPIFDALASLIAPFAMIAEASNNMWGGAGPIFERMGTSASAVKGAVDSITNAVKGLIDMIPGLGPGLRLLEMFNRLIPGGPSSSGTPSAIVIPSSGGGMFGGGGSFDTTASAPTGLLGAGGSDDMGVGLPNSSGRTPSGPLSTVDAGGGGLLGGGAGVAASQGDVGGPGLGLLPAQPNAGLLGYPVGGYPVPPPPAPKGAAGSSATDAPPFIDPSLYSVDAIPVTALPNGLASPSGMTPNAQNLNNIMSALFPMLPAAGGWREPDGFNEHSSGEAVDFMTGGNFALGDAMNQFMLQQADALGLQYTIWKQMQWFPDGRVSAMPDRGDPTQNHMDHVHARVKPGPASAGGIAFPGQNAGAGAQAMMGSYQVDPEAVMRAENAMIAAENSVEEKRLRLRQLEASGTATQLQLLEARNNVTEAENRYREADLNLQQARQGKYKEMDGKLKGVAQGLGDIGAALADDFGLSEGLPGMAKWLTTFLANLAFAPMMGQLSAISAANPIQGGHGMLGIMGAQNIAAGGSPLGLSAPGGGMPGIGGGVPGMGGLTAMPGMSATPAMPAAAVAPMMPTPMMPTPAAIGPAPIGGGMGSPGFGMGVPSGMPGAMPGAAAGPATAQTSQAPQAASPGGGFQGLGGLPMEAMMTATAGLDLLAPGASQAAQVGIKLANRTIAYGGQLAAIGVGGLMETFLPNNSSLADPSKSWVGRIAAGIAGARPALPNTAGGAAPAQTPMPEQQQGQGQGQGGPGVVVENLNNYSNDGGQTVANQLYRSYAAGGAR